MAVKKIEDGQRSGVISWRQFNAFVYIGVNDEGDACYSLAPVSWAEDPGEDDLILDVHKQISRHEGYSDFLKAWLEAAGIKVIEDPEIVTAVLMQVSGTPPTEVLEECDTTQLRAIVGDLRETARYGEEILRARRGA
jgi:hypothetical protein